MFQWNDNTRALLMQAIKSVFPVLVFLEVITWTSTETALVIYMIDNFVALSFAAFKRGQQAGGPVVVEHSEIETTRTTVTPTDRVVSVPAQPSNLVPTDKPVTSRRRPPARKKP